MKLVNKSAVMKPAFFIAVHRQRRCVVMGVRGTNTAHDVLTDLTPHSEPFEGGQVCNRIYSYLSIEETFWMKCL